jgi:hypothetical protein
VKLGKGGNMFDEHRRPVGRLFYLLAFVLVWIGACWGQAPNTTTISEGLFASRSGAENKRGVVVCIRGRAADGCRDFPSHY